MTGMNLSGRPVRTLTALRPKQLKTPYLQQVTTIQTKLARSLLYLYQEAALPQSKKR
jgi:hypothetical protein